MTVYELTSRVGDCAHIGADEIPNRIADDPELTGCDPRAVRVVSVQIQNSQTEAVLPSLRGCQDMST